MKSVKCASGLRGWQAKLREVYDNYADFKWHSNVYQIHQRLGFASPRAAWIKNPLIEGSVTPSDLRVVPSASFKRYKKKFLAAYAKRKNTKAAARRLMQVDEGHYTVTR